MSNPMFDFSIDEPRKSRLREVIEYAFPEAAVQVESTKPVSPETVVLHSNESKIVDVTVLTSRIKNPA